MTVVSVDLAVETRTRSQMIDITAKLRGIVKKERVRTGRMTVSVPHTTAGITINEHADPDVAEDILEYLEGAVPWKGDWRHAEGNSAAHIKTLLTGSSVTLWVVDGSLELGTWQGVFFCEFDGPRRRRVSVRCEILS